MLPARGARCRCLLPVFSLQYYFVYLHVVFSTLNALKNLPIFAATMSCPDPACPIPLCVFPILPSASSNTTSPVSIKSSVQLSFSNFCDLSYCNSRPCCCKIHLRTFRSVQPPPIFLQHTFIKMCLLLMLSHKAICVIAVVVYYLNSYLFLRYRLSISKVKKFFVGKLTGCDVHIVSKQIVWILHLFYSYKIL